jgi:hypothetical protein
MNDVEAEARKLAAALLVEVAKKLNAASAVSLAAYWRRHNAGERGSSVEERFIYGECLTHAESHVRQHIHDLTGRLPNYPSRKRRDDPAVAEALFEIATP